MVSPTRKPPTKSVTAFTFGVVLFVACFSAAVVTADRYGVFDSTTPAPPPLGDPIDVSIDAPPHPDEADEPVPDDPSEPRLNTEPVQSKPSELEIRNE